MLTWTPAASVQRIKTPFGKPARSAVVQLTPPPMVPVVNVSTWTTRAQPFLAVMFWQGALNMTWYVPTPRLDEENTVLPPALVPFELMAAVQRK